MSRLLTRETRSVVESILALVSHGRVDKFHLVLVRERL